MSDDLVQCGFYDCEWAADFVACGDHPSDPLPFFVYGCSGHIASMLRMVPMPNKEEDFEPDGYLWHVKDLLDWKVEPHGRF